MLKQFRDFISRGNVIDLAVGIIIGAAFTTVVNSLVNDILMPPIGMILGGVDFSNLFVTLSDGTYDSLAEAQAAGAATLNYGLFINALINFLIVAAALFFIVQTLNRLKAEEEAAEPSTRPCPHCISEISIQATRCPHCTSALEVG